MGRMQKAFSPADYINPALKLDDLATTFQAGTRLQIQDFFQSEPARDIADSLANDVPWSVALRDGAQNKQYTAAEWGALDQRLKQKLLMDAAMNARNGAFQYVFEYYQIHTAYLEKQPQSDRLNRLVEFVLSDAFLAFARRLTGDQTITSADCQATRYRPGHYLTMHHDHHIASRRAAYVMNFSKDWHPDWGGLLQFFDGHGNIVAGYRPIFNSMMVFRVPQDHSVSYVTPHAPHPRLSITGWFHA